MDKPNLLAILEECSENLLLLEKTLITLGNVLEPITMPEVLIRPAPDKEPQNFPVVVRQAIALNESISNLRYRVNDLTSGVCLYAGEYSDKEMAEQLNAMELRNKKG